MSKIDFSTFYLNNGLKVLVYEDHSVAKVAVDIIYKVGARDEEENLTGFAHLFEHLMFGGSKNIPNYDTPLQKVGGSNNAYTTNDITNYYLSLPSNQLETAFWLESDRMLELEFSQKSLDTQKSVVCEEFKQRYLNQPYGDPYLLIRPVHYQVHPYKWATIGKELSHIEKAQMSDVKNFFYSHYAPNNATLVVVGDVKLAEVERLANKWFGPIPNRELKPKVYAQEPKQTESRFLKVHKEVPFAAVYKCYHIPERSNFEYYACDMITDLLSGNSNSILIQKMVKETGVASSISAFSWGSYDPGMVSIEGKVAEDRTVEEFEQILNEALLELNNVTENDLRRTKNMYESLDVFHKTTFSNIASSLATYDSIGNPNLINTILSEYEKINLNDIHNANLNYFRPENCTTLHYLPENY